MSIANEIEQLRTKILKFEDAGQEAPWPLFAKLSELQSAQLLEFTDKLAAGSLEGLDLGDEDGLQLSGSLLLGLAGAGSGDGDGVGHTGAPLIEDGAEFSSSGTLYDNSSKESLQETGLTGPPPGMSTAAILKAARRNAKYDDGTRAAARERMAIFRAKERARDEGHTDGCHLFQGDDDCSCGLWKELRAEREAEIEALHHEADCAFQYGDDCDLDCDCEWFDLGDCTCGGGKTLVVGWWPCARPGCPKPVERRETGRVRRYCGSTCKTWAYRQRKKAKSNPQVKVESVYETRVQNL